jgi:hypothetical protein
MEVQIGVIESEVRATSDVMPSPQAMANIASAMLKILEERDAKRQQRRAETRITRGVSHELDEEQ